MPAPAHWPDYAVWPEHGIPRAVFPDADGDPIPNAAWEAELPDGTKLTGQLDAQGSGKIDTKGAKTCVVRFPQLPTSHWEAKQPQPGASS